MRVELRHLRYFVAVAEELHFGRAAERVFLSQPALSQQIAQLEGELGVRLFERTSRQVNLTSAGNTLLRVARQTLALVERGVEEVRWQGGLGRLRVGYPALLNATRWPLAFRAFTDRYPEVELEESEWLPAQVPRALHDGRIDVGFTHSATPMEGLRQHVLEPLELVAVVPERHPLACHKMLEMRDLDGASLLLPPRDVSPGFYDHVLACAARAGVLVSPVSGREPGLLSAETLARLVASGVGIAVSFALLPDRYPSTVRLPLRGHGVALQLLLVLPQEGALSLSSAFLAEVQAFKQTETRSHRQTPP